MVRGRRARWVWLALGLASLLLPGLSLGPPHPRPQLRAGVFLVATPQLAHGVFGEAVILITQYGSRGAMGLAVNRPTPVTLHEAFPAIAALRSRKETIFLGGPVRPHALFVLVRSSRPPAGMQHVGGDVYLAHNVEAVAPATPKEGAKRAVRVFAGYAGWAPAQLEAELSRGDWLVAPEEPALALSPEPEGLWKRLFAAWSGRWI